jgi:hypothetical protein
MEATALDKARAMDAEACCRKEIPGPSSLEFPTD